MESIAIYQVISRILLAIENCKTTGNTEWEALHRERLAALVREHLPSGSGIFCGTVLDEHYSTSERLRFIVEYHHMNDVGCYIGWKTYLVICEPSLAWGVNIHVQGGDPETREYLGELYTHALTQQIER